MSRRGRASMLEELEAARVTFDELEKELTEISFKFFEKRGLTREVVEQMTEADIKATRAADQAT